MVMESELDDNTFLKNQLKYWFNRRITELIKHEPNQAVLTNFLLTIVNKEYTRSKPFHSNWHVYYDIINGIIESATKYKFNDVLDWMTNEAEKILWQLN